VAYEGLNYPIRIQLETMCQNDFMSKSTDEAWSFLKDFAEKDQQWKSIHVPSRERIRGIHTIDPNLFPIEDP